MLRSLLLLTALAACTTGDGTTTFVRTDGGDMGDDDDADDDACASPLVRIVNDSGLTLSQVEYGTCDAMAGPTSPLLERPLLPGEDLDAALPAPDCYFLVLSEASGCLVPDPIQTGPLDACELYTLTVTNDLFICTGGR